jgi:positive regulator of sigma E activity
VLPNGGQWMAACDLIYASPQIIVCVVQNLTLKKLNLHFLLFVQQLTTMLSWCVLNHYINKVNKVEHISTILLACKIS